MQTLGPTAAMPMRAIEARKHSWLLVGSILLLLAVLCVGSAHAATLLDRLTGSWSGSGQIRYDDGQAEGVRCSAYYTGGSDRLRLAIRCRSDSTEVEIRGLLTRQGETLGGTWEERTFNASGEASGRIAGDKMSLSVSGGGYSGSMTVAYAGSRQVVTISTQGIRMRSVNVTLARVKPKLPGLRWEFFEALQSVGIDVPCARYCLHGNCGEQVEKPVAVWL